MCACARLSVLRRGYNIGYGHGRETVRPKDDLAGGGWCWEEQSLSLDQVQGEPFCLLVFRYTYTVHVGTRTTANHT